MALRRGADVDPDVQPTWVRQAEEGTASCMHAAGFAHHPDEAVGTGWWAQPDGHGTVAVADATCRDEVGYRTTLHEVETQPEDESADTYRDDLERWPARAQAQRTPSAG